MNAEERASQMMGIPTNELPHLATGYLKFLCSKYGGCTEVVLIAFSHYAQAIENLEGLPTITKEGKQWFEEHRTIS